MTHTMKGTAEMTGAMLISGSIGVLVVLSGQSVSAVVFWRCLFGALTLLVVCSGTGRLRHASLTLPNIGLAALSGVAIVFNWLLLFGAYSRSSISIATVVYNFQPFILVGLGVLILGERLTLRVLGWLALSFAGMLLVVGGEPGRGVDGDVFLVGIGMALGAAFFYALAAIVIKRLVGMPPHLIALIQVTVGVAMLAPFAARDGLPEGWASWSMLATLGIIHTGGMYVLLYGAIQKLPTSVISALTFIYPLVATAADLIVFGHHLRPTQVLGGGAILLAVAGMTLGWRLRLPGRECRRYAD